MLYKRTKTTYTRNTPNCKWKESEVEVDYCGEVWVDKMTGKEEVRFFNNLSWARGGHIKYSSNKFFTSISPDKLTKVYDLFEPVYIPGAVTGRREWAAISYATHHMRCTDSSIVNGHELLVIPYQDDDGEERTVTYDLTNEVFVA